MNFLEFRPKWGYPDTNKGPWEPRSMQARFLCRVRHSSRTTWVYCMAIGTLVGVLCGAPAVAGVTNVSSQVVPQSTVPGFTTNDLLIDFTGNLRGQQMIVSLTRGSIYQDGFGVPIRHPVRHSLRSSHR